MDSKFLDDTLTEEEENALLDLNVNELIQEQMSAHIEHGDFAEQDIKVQKKIDELTKNKMKIEIMGSEVDLNSKRRMAHTPLDGVLKEEDQNEHIERLAKNKWLRSFVTKHEREFE
jgi:hypothetical protein